MLILTRLCNVEIVQFAVSLSKEALSHTTTCILGPSRDSCLNLGRHKRDIMFMLCFYTLIYWVMKFQSTPLVTAWSHSVIS